MSCCEKKDDDNQHSDKDSWRWIEVVGGTLAFLSIFSLQLVMCAASYSWSCL